MKDVVLFRVFALILVLCGLSFLVQRSFVLGLILVGAGALLVLIGGRSA